MIKNKAVFSSIIFIILISIGTIISVSIGYSIAEYLISEDRKVAESEVNSLVRDSDYKQAYGIFNDTQVGGGCTGSRYRFYSGGFEVLSIYRTSSEFIITRTYPGYIDFNEPCEQIKGDPNNWAKSMLTAFMTVPIKKNATVASIFGEGSSLPLSGREEPNAYGIIQNLPSYKSDYHEFVPQKKRAENITQNYTYKGELGVATVKSENQVYRIEQIDNKVLVTRLLLVVMSELIFLGITFGIRTIIRRKSRLQSIS